MIVHEVQNYANEKVARYHKEASRTLVPPRWKRNIAKGLRAWAEKLEPSYQTTNQAHILRKL